jgi:hypothetical protein
MTSAAVFAAGSVPGQVVCLDLEQTTLVGNLTGSITGGAGRSKQGTRNDGDVEVKCVPFIPTPPPPR